MRTLLLMVLLAACTSNNTGSPDLAMPKVNDLSMISNPDLSPSCSMTPMTHIELLNACTNADSVDKTPFYPSLAQNGQLPPLP